MMLLSNRLTFCITTFIFLLAFAALPVMAHEGADANAHDSGADGTTNPTPVGHVEDDHPTVTVGATGADDDPATSITIVGGADDGKTYIKANIASTRLDPAVDAVNTVTLRITFSEDVLYTTPADGAITSGLFTSVPADGTDEVFGDLLTVKIGVEGTNELLYYGAAAGTSPSVGAAFGSLTTAITSIAVNPVDLTDDDPATTPNNNSKSMFDVTFTLAEGALPVIAEEESAADAGDAIAAKNILFEVVVEGASAEALPDFQAVDPLARWNSMPSDATLFYLVPTLPSQYDPGTPNTGPTVAVSATGPSTQANPIPPADVATSEVTFTVTVSDDEIGGAATDGVVNFSEVTITNGDVEDFVISGTTTTVVITPREAGPVTLTVMEGAIIDAGGLRSAVASRSHTIYVIDNEAPDIWVIAPIAPNSNGDLEFLITSDEHLYDRVTNPTLRDDIPALTINDIAIDTAETHPLADGDLSSAMRVTTAAPFPWPIGPWSTPWTAKYEQPHTRELPGGGTETFIPSKVKEYYLLTVSPRAANSVVRVEAKANAAEDLAGNFTPGAEDQYDPETGKPTIAISAVNLNNCDPLPKLHVREDTVDALEGGRVTLTAMDRDSPLASGAHGQITHNEVKVDRGEIKAGSFTTSGATATFILEPYNGETSVTVTVQADAVRDAAGNMNIAKAVTFNVGPVFLIPANTILVITKKGPGSPTYDYLSDQPRLPINEDPPTPAPNIAVDVWCNMPDLEVLFNLHSRGGTVSMAKHPTSGNFDLNQVRISEVMWASDLSERGGTTDDPEAEDQWIEIENYGNSPARVFLYARTAQSSANTHGRGYFDRVGNAYDGIPGYDQWPVPGQNGNSYTGLENFISMWRHFNIDKRNHERYALGTAKGAWSASNREYIREQSRAENTDNEFSYIGSPGRLHSYKFSDPGLRAAVTAIPGSEVKEDEKLIINEVSNRRDPRYEWIELRNVGSQPADLRSFQISIVTAVGTDNLFVGFRNNESHKIPAGGVLLLVATDPRYDDDHPLAVGYNIDINENDQVPGIGRIVGDSPRKDAVARYKVFDGQRGNTGWGVNNAGLPDNGEFILIVRSPDNDKGHGDHNHGDRGRSERGTADLNRISDIAGYHPNLVGPDNYPGTNPANLNKTYLWPLVNFDNSANRPDHIGRQDMRPREENRNNRTNRLEAGKVRYRQHVVTSHANNRNEGTKNRAGTGTRHHDEKTEHYAFRDAGYTGWGYKRTARRDLRVHNGTPGYHGNIRNTTTKTDTADALVTISEVMYATGPDPSNPVLPQWIELYNSSATQAVDLGSGWRLMIEMLDASGNPMDSLLTISFKDKGRVKHIYPQQTVLIVAGNARQAGSDFQPPSVVFPDNRVFNVYRDIGAGKLGTNTRYQFFNPNAFALVLVDKDGRVVDQMGNLDGDARTSDTAAWEMPSAITVDVDRSSIEADLRSSIVRIYDDGTGDNDHSNDGNTWHYGKPRPGTGLIVPMPSDKNALLGVKGIDPKYSWIPAVNTELEFKITVKSTWYGDEDDYGTPGHRPGLVLPVELSFFRPTLEDGKVTIRWTTESELDNAGFNILRSETRSGEYTQVNAELIQGAGTTGERTTYSWVDQTAKPGVVYYYQIEDVSFAGERQALAITKLKGLISADNKLTTTWSELKEASQ